MEGIEDNKKKKDGRANNGALKGVYRGQGRPPKAREKKLGNYALGAMKKVFGIILMVVSIKMLFFSK